MRNGKKIFVSCFVIGLLLISSYTVIGIGKNDVINEDMALNVQFSEPIITASDSYIQVTVAGANAVFSHAGKPVLPVYRTTLTLPFGTKILNVECITQNIGMMLLSKKIEPAPEPVLSGMEDPEIKYDLDTAIYDSSNLYPETWFNYYTGGGLDENNEHKTFLIVEVYPVRYAPATNIIQYAEDIDLTITYHESSSDPFQATADYKLVIIAPSKFQSQLNALVTHKTGKGLTTTLKTTEDIYAEFQGVDKPEQIKNFIKYAVENYGTEYVLLVGGLKSLIFGAARDDKNQGTKDWYLPVRYTNHKDQGSIYDPGFISDLYYADIYDSEGNFSSWDSNGDGVFAKSGMSRDIIDNYPDVFVGRLPCRNTYEVNIMVDKIIAYENEPSSSWFNKIIAVAGDSHDDDTSYNEGEVVTEKILNEEMSGFTSVRLYSSNEQTDPTLTPITENIVREISNGAGYLLFDGHGNPYKWNTHWSNYGDWTGGILMFDFPDLKNGVKLPVCVVGGCHNSMFNVTLLYTLLDETNAKHSWCSGVPAPECWSWWLTRKIDGGSIATIGNTGLGYGAVGESGDINGDNITEPDCLEGLGGYIEVLFFKTINEDTDILGEAHSGALTKYMNTFPPMSDDLDQKTVQEWALIGDPSLKMGGYTAVQ